MKRRSNAGFTLMELTIASAVSAGVAVALGAFSLISARLAGRNMASNHGHSSITDANQRLLKDLQASGSAFQLMTYNGSAFTDVTPTASADQDPMTGQTLSNRTNAFRYWKVGGGPYQLTGPTTVTPLPPTATSLTFYFGPLVNSKLPYTPMVNDKVWFPLLDREFKITAIPSMPTEGNPTGTITIHDTNGIGYTLELGSPNVTTAMFFHQVYYYAYDNKLWMDDSSMPKHPITVHEMITSPKPFSVLFPTSSSPSSDQLTMRISLEAYDLSYSKPAYPNGATTMQTCISVRNQPPFVSLAQTPQ